MTWLIDSLVTVLVGLIIAAIDVVPFLAGPEGVIVGVIASAVILILGKPAFDALKDYRKQRAAGKNPHFKAADIGLTNTECWK